MYIVDASQPHCSPHPLSRLDPIKGIELYKFRQNQVTPNNTTLYGKPDENVNVHSFFYLRQNTRNGLHFNVNGINVF